MPRWKTVKDFPDYHVNDEGKLFSKRTRREIVGSLNVQERTRVILRRDGQNHQRYIVNLIAEAFLEPQPRPDYWLEHLDGDMYNCRPDNLAWTNTGYIRHRPKNRNLMIVETGEEFRNAAEVAQFLNVSKAAVSKHLNGKQLTLRGMTVVYMR